MGEWREVRLGEVVEEIIDRRGVTPLKLGSDFTGSGHRVISAKLVKGGRVDEGADTPRFVDFVTYRKWMRSPLLRDDVLLTSEAPLGEVAYLNEDQAWCLGQRLFGIRTNKRLCLGRFLYYALRSDGTRADLLNRATGTTAQGIRQRELRLVRLPLPPLTVQRAIAHILGTLDDRIEVNRRTNETLEAMARALFKSWFVDFDPVRAKAEGRGTGLPSEFADLFPDSFEDSELGEVPRGWGIESLSAIAEFRNGLALQRYRPGHGEPRLPVVKIAQLGSGIANSGEWAAGTIPPGCVVEDGDVLFSWSGTLMARVWRGGRAALNQHLFRVTSRTSPRWFYLGWICEHLPSFQEIAADKATTMGHINRHHLEDARCVVPPGPIIAAADRILGPLLSKQVSMARQHRSLSALRDSLLPRLVTGAIDTGAGARATLGASVAPT